MDFRILGSFEVRAGGAVLPLGGLRERTVLAVLVLDAGRMVSVTRLVDAVWPDDPPETAVKQVRNAVSRLRGALAAGGSPAAVQADGGGYRLDVPGEDIDARVFEAQVREAERAAVAGLPGQAAAMLCSALALWRGPLLAGMPGPVLEAASAAWEERRRRAQDSYYEQMLGLGRHAEVIPELSAVLGEDRLRERTAAQLMLALYRCGRQGDALMVYRELSAALAGRLGLDPGAGLDRLHQQILTRDPALGIQERPREAAGELRQPDEPRVVGRCREMAEVGRLLDGACRGVGGMLVVCGPAGSGKTLIAEAAAADARRRGFEVLWTRPAEGQPGRMAWAQLLRGTGALHALVAGLLGKNAGPLDLDGAAAHLVSGPLRLIVVDDVDRGGPDAIEMLSVVAARSPAAPVAVLATTASPLGLRPELRLGGLSEEELASALGELDPETSRALWLASRGLPGVAGQLARGLADRADGTDPVVHLALTATASTPFLIVDTSLVRLLEAAAARARDDGSKARVLARLARALLGDALAAARRRALADEALVLARHSGDPRVLADVLDARLHALWDQRAAEDRLAAGSEIIDLARAAGDGKRERNGMFWRFVALMELGRVAEAESALAAYTREAEVAGDAQASAMATARHGMLAVLHGRFAQAGLLTSETERAGERAGLADTAPLTMMLRGAVALEVDFTGEPWECVPDLTLASARERPGHLFEATAARLLAALGRLDDASAELDRSLTRALAGSGPRWLGGMADLAAVAAATGDCRAAARIYEAMLPYRGRLVVYAGANSAWGPVSHHLGLLAVTMGKIEQAVRHFEEAVEFGERTGALPYLAHSLAGLAGALADSGDAGRAAACLGRSREIAQRLGMAVLLRRLGASASEWSLRRDGEDWLLAAGDEHARLRDVRGLHYLRALLAAPGREIRALDLAAGGAGLAPAPTGPALDGVARDAYRRRLGELTALLEGADRAGDTAAAERAGAERSALLRELRGAAGLGGRSRDVAPEAERARVNVTRTLRTTIERIAVAAPVAAAHLRASVRTGASCRYEPAPGGPDRWLV